MKPLDKTLVSTIQCAIKSFMDINKIQAVTTKNSKGAGIFIASQITGLVKNVIMQDMAKDDVIIPMLAEDYNHMVKRHEKYGEQIKYFVNKTKQQEQRIKELEAELHDIDSYVIGAK